MSRPVKKELNAFDRNFLRLWRSDTIDADTAVSLLYGAYDGALQVINPRLRIGEVLLRVQDGAPAQPEKADPQAITAGICLLDTPVCELDLLEKDDLVERIKQFKRSCWQRWRKDDAPISYRRHRRRKKPIR